MKSRLKIILAGVLVIALLVGVTACDTGNDDTVTTPPENDNPTLDGGNLNTESDPNLNSEVVTFDLDDEDFDPFSLVEGLAVDEFLADLEVYTIYLIDLTQRFEANPDKDAFADELAVLAEEFELFAFKATLLAMQLEENDDEAVDYYNSELDRISGLITPEVAQVLDYLIFDDMY
ncbi:MAG: hypothetical protein FWH20_07990 [Oscillospiraceae bacterium]|nr:hypothetical protein [Oscillospiraceae bacterium]